MTELSLEKQLSRVSLLAESRFVPMALSKSPQKYTLVEVLGKEGNSRLFILANLPVSFSCSQSSRLALICMTGSTLASPKRMFGRAW